MSKGNQNGVARAEFQAIKQQLKTAGITEVAKTTGRSMSTISKIKRATSYAKFIDLNKGYAAVQAQHRKEAKVAKAAQAEQPKAPAKKAAPKAIVPVQKSRKVKVVVTTPSDVAPLLDTLKKPERRSKAHAKEVLDLQTQLHAAQDEARTLRSANEMLNHVNEQLNKELAEYEANEVIAKARAGRSFVGRIKQLRRRKVGA